MAFKQLFRNEKERQRERERGRGRGRGRERETETNQQLQLLGHRAVLITAEMCAGSYEC